MPPKGQNPKQKQIRNDTLLEVLRDLGSGTGKSFSQDFLSKIPEDILDQTSIRPKRLSGTLSPNESITIPEKPKVEDLERRLRRVEAIRRQEKLVFSAEKQKETLKVKALQQEVDKLAKATANLSREVKTATTQAPVEPGTYHLTFYEKLLSFIQSLTKKIEDAAIWVSVFNTRAKKRSYYWTQVGRSGAKYMLSQERYMSTQAG